MSYRKSVDPLDAGTQIYLGGKVSQKHILFKMLAKLGYDEAEQYAALLYFEWLDKNQDKPLLEQVKKLIELMGMAHFLPHTKELTRLSMILGDFHKRKKWE
jgi:dissimilatory sulfite reductase (desulfoviridin) alpha/beta subunit